MTPRHGGARTWWGPAVVAGFAVIALIGPELIPPEQVSVVRADGPLLAPPSLRFPAGTDENGRSVLMLLLWGTRPTLLVAVAATVLAIGTATVVGVLAGHFTGRIATALGLLVEWFLVLPQLPFAAAVAAVSGPGTGPVVAAIAATSWASAARTLQIGVRVIENRPHLDPVRALGGSHRHQLRKYILPEVLPLILANTLLTVANAVLTVSTLAFLGLGHPDQPTWGSTLRQAAGAGAVTAGAWWYLLAPGLCVVLLVLALGGCARHLESALEIGAGRPFSPTPGSSTMAETGGNRTPPTNRGSSEHPT